MNLVQIQLLSALMTVAALVGTALGVIAAATRAFKAEQKSSNENWQGAVDALTAHNEALKEIIEDMEQRQTRKETELAEVKGLVLAREVEVKRLEKGESAWARRNAVLYDMAMDYRDRLAKLGVDVPIPNGG